LMVVVRRPWPRPIFWFRRGWTWWRPSSESTIWHCSPRTPKLSSLMSSLLFPSPLLAKVTSHARATRTRVSHSGLVYIDGTSLDFPFDIASNNYSCLLPKKTLLSRRRLVSQEDWLLGNVWYIKKTDYNNVACSLSISGCGFQRLNEWYSIKNYDT
jgi:hypothetical protein